MPTVLDNLQSMPFFLPETILTVGAVFVFLLDLAVARHRQRIPVLTGAALLVIGLAAVATYATSTRLIPGVEATPLEHPIGLFYGLIVLDPWAVFFKYLSLGITALAIWMAGPSLEIASERIGEYCALLLAIAVGLCLMASSVDLLMIVIGIELVSMVSYALAGFRKHHRKSSEAALKYVVYGGVASGMMLFGASYLYGLLGTSNLIAMRQPLMRYGEEMFLSTLQTGQAGAGQMAIVLALVLVLSGVGYKIASVPWHMWCPDVYEGAPTPFTAFLSVGPKAAGFALVVRIFYGAMSESGGAELARVISDVPWPAVIGVISAITMTVGNFAALNQTNLKRMLAYSSIAHAGYLLMGLTAVSTTGNISIVLYLMIYLFMNVGAFIVVGAVGRLAGSESIFEYRGLAVRAPFAAVAFAIFLFSLTGLPPLAGFIGKLHLFMSVMNRGGTWYTTLAIVGVLNSAISLYYYARIVKAMFLDKPLVRDRIVVPGSYNVLLGMLVAAVLVFGVYFEPLRRLAQNSLRMFGHV